MQDDDVSMLHLLPTAAIAHPSEYNRVCDDSMIGSVMSNDDSNIAYLQLTAATAHPSGYSDRPGLNWEVDVLAIGQELQRVATRSYPVSLQGYKGL